ncbi:MAG: HAMP domain-containing sensor histidine kinase [Ignavibacteriaceae bacterium]
MKNKYIKKLFVTDTIKRFTIANVILFLFILILFNILTISLTSFLLHQSLDARLEHEIENILITLTVENGRVEVIDYRELNEPDFKKLTGNPYFLQIYSQSGEIIIESDNIKLYHPLPINPEIFYSDYEFMDLKINKDMLRVAYYPLLDNNNDYVATLQLAIFESDYIIVMRRVILFNLILFPVVLLMVILASFYISRRSFLPINKIMDTANAISASNLSERISVDAKPEDEPGRLRDTLNNLFDRIESYVDEVSHFTDQASHQLVNPLTAIKSELDYLLKKERTTNEYKEALIVLQKQADSMISIVKTLLIIAKSDKRKTESHSIFNFTNLILNEVKSYFTDNKITYEIEKDIYLRGESDKFLMLMQNLVNNAIKFSDVDSTIRIILKKTFHNVELSVEDSGIGISDDEKEKVFERFYRSERTEKFGLKGHGLGLSLVKSIVTEAKGKIEIQDNIPKGTIIKIVLPALELE